jgi:hypothetical protein
MCDEYVSEELDHILLDCPAYASVHLSLLKLMKDFFLQDGIECTKDLVRSRISKKEKDNT